MGRFLAPFLVALLTGISGCGGDDAPDSGGNHPPVSFEGAEQGVTPFISLVRLSGQRLSELSSASYVIEPKPGTASRPVRVSYSRAALTIRNYLEFDRLTLPVFGLYANYANPVSINLQFTDGSSQTIAQTLTTDGYVDPTGIYENPDFILRRAVGSELGFDFFALKSNLGTPVIVDTDGAVRWAGTGIESALSSIFINNTFVIGELESTRIHRLALDGSIVSAPLSSGAYTIFHHNIDRGRDGLLGHFDSAVHVESLVAEFTENGTVIRQWDFAKILSDYMASEGDDPALFVRPGIDWFHSNAATYDPADDSLIVSSRENFLIKVDYDTGRIVWILGDPTKYWWTFPSLRAKALTVEAPGLYPIGQHATSITSDGLLMVFNNGLQSLNQPAGMPTGNSLTQSPVSAYRIDVASMTATEALRFDHDATIYSPFCSSVYEAAGGSLLINYTRAENGTRNRVVGLNARREVVFDFQYQNSVCNTAWNAAPVPLEDLNYR
jgi:arylsulfate sulfotransferase